MIHDVRAVLFDAVGTLIETTESIGETYARWAHRFGVDVSPVALESAFRGAFGRSAPRVFPHQHGTEVEASERAWWRRLVAEVFREAAPESSFDDFGAFFDSLFDHYATAAPEHARDVRSDESAWTMRAGASAMLRELRGRGLALGIVSNFDHRLPKILESLEIAVFFDTVVTSTTHGAEKPDARLFRAAARALQVEASEALYVGDDPTRDLAGARNAGLQTLDVRSLPTLEDLPAQIATLAGRTRTSRTQPPR